MKNNIVTTQTIKQHTFLSLKSAGMITILVSLLLFLTVIFTINLTDDGRMNSLAIALLVMIIAIALPYIGKNIRFFQKWACTGWYNWDKKRLAFLRKERNAFRERFEAAINKATEELLKNDPAKREELKVSTIEWVKKFLATLEKEKEEADKRLSQYEEIEVVAIVQLKARYEEQQEGMVEWLLDFLSEIKREELNEDLARQRIRNMLDKNHAPYYKERLRWYDELIESCKTSTAELAKMIQKN